VSGDAPPLRCPAAGGAGASDRLRREFVVLG